MNIPFETKYINIDWEDDKTASKILEAKESIGIEPLSQNSFKLEAVTYKKIEENISGQLAFHITDKQFKKKPYFINAKNEKIELLPIKDKYSKKIWWIEKGIWNTKSKYRSSVLCRTVGETRLIIGEYTCFIHIGSLSFTYDEVELYLKDFRSDLWALIQRDDSYVLGEAKIKEVKIAKIELIEKIQSFISFTEKILKNPKKELMREQILQKVSQVKPINKTFIELAIKGLSAKYLTGQGYKDSLDVAENRYIFALVQKINTLISHEIDTSYKRIDELEKELKDIGEQIKSLSDKLNLGVLTVNKKEIKQEIKNILSFQNKSLKKILTNQVQVKIENLKTNIILLERKSEYRNELQFWGKIKEKESDDWHKIKEENSLQFIFDKSIFDKQINNNFTYKIIAHYQKDSKVPKNNGGKIIKRRYNYISELELINIPQIDKLKKLEKDGWQRELEKDEITEFKYELKALKNKKVLLSQQLDKSRELLILLALQLTRLKKIKQFFISHKIKSRYHFTGSMTFIQNQNYQGCHKLYKQIINKSGMNDDLFESLEEVDKIGILDIPKVYERWCLLQIIKVLVDKFHFIPTDKYWKKILVEEVSVQNPKNISLNFKNSKIEREICLTYEMVLKNRKAPDFVLDIKGGLNKSYRFVMDAKFYEILNISKVVDELYNKKDYAEQGNNSVFILHPSKNQKSFYGEKKLFEWDDNYPNHKYGAISLSPVQKEGNYINDLQKLIGMFLQYGMEDNQNIKINGKIDPIPKDKIFCVICGSDKQKEQRKPAGYVNYKYWVTCNECSHMTIYNYCGNCKSRLVKNGSYWTYHTMDILEPINIQCPNCGDML